jgi:DNA polymerase I-like protein with 3'-5' exonuclease and polymerase domains
MSSSSAISIPFVRVANPQERAANVQFESFWSPFQEAQIIKRMRTILAHPNVSLIGQNFLYDTQYLEEEFGIIPRCEFDTMLAHHLIFPGTPKGLDWLSSLYCEHHKYWKDDGKDWHVNDDLESQLKYNCLDCCKTIEIANELESIIEGMNLQPQWAETMERWKLSARMTRRGVLIDKAEVKRQSLSIMLQKQKIEAWLLARFPQAVAGSGTGDSLWFDSPKQLATFLYDKQLGLGLTPIKSRGTGRISTGKEALEELRHRYPRLMPLFDALSALRSLSVFMSHFLRKPLDPDGRMRCSYGPAGTETFRFNSSENAFGRGTNLQNIPSGNEE